MPMCVLEIEHSPSSAESMLILICVYVCIHMHVIYIGVFVGIKTRQGIRKGKGYEKDRERRGQ